MIVLTTVAIGLVLLASQTCADARICKLCTCRKDSYRSLLLKKHTSSNICAGRKDGAHLPNLDDCSSFFVCNFGESKLFECPGGLLYDHSKRACNWENVVNCDWNAIPDTEIPTTLSSQTQEGTTKAPQTEKPTTQAPQTEMPTTNSPQTEIPTAHTHSPQTEIPTTISTQSPSNNTNAPGPVRPTLHPEFTSNKPVVGLIVI